MKLAPNYFRMSCKTVMSIFMLWSLLFLVQNTKENICVYTNKEQAGISKLNPKFGLFNFEFFVRTHNQCQLCLFHDIDEGSIITVSVVTVDMMCAGPNV